MSTFSSGFVDSTTLERYETAGFGRPVGLGTRPALLVIDVQYRTTGTEPMDFMEAVKEFPTSVGRDAWDAVANIKSLIELFRVRSWPVMFPHVAPKKSFDAGALGAKVPSIMTISDKGYEFVPDVAPVDGDILLPKKHPSAFFGTPLVSHLVGAGADSLVVTGCSTSGCVRSTVVDGFSYNYRVAVPSDAVYDRSQVVHEVNLFDMDQKYADVDTTDALIGKLEAIGEDQK